MPCVPCGIGVNEQGFFLQLCGSYVFGGPDIPTASTQPPHLIVRQPSANLTRPLLREDSSESPASLSLRQASSVLSVVLPETRDIGVQTSSPSPPLSRKGSLEWDDMSELGQPFNSSPTSPSPPLPGEALAALAELRASSLSNIEGNRSHSASSVTSTPRLSSKAQHLFGCVGDTLTSIEALMMMDGEDIALESEDLTHCLDWTVNALKAYDDDDDPQSALALTYAIDLEMVMKGTSPEVVEGRVTSIPQLLHMLKEWCLQVQNAAFV